MGTTLDVQMSSKHTPFYWRGKREGGREGSNEFNRCCACVMLLSV